MPSISTSKDWNMAQAVSPVYGGTPNSDAGYPYSSFITWAQGGSYSNFQSCAAILKGTMPATPPADWNAYQSNMLVKYALWGYGQGYGGLDGTTFAQSTNVEDVTTLITVPSAANASGLATWFWYFTGRPAYSSYDMAQSVIGTVGMPGSGADLILTDTNIITGTLYKIVLPIKWPTQWTY